MRKLFVNPYTGQVQDFALIPTGPGGAKSCPVTGKPLNKAAVNLYSYEGPATDRAAWAADATKVVEEIERQVNEPNAATLGVSAPAPAPAAQE